LGGYDGVCGNEFFVLFKWCTFKRFKKIRAADIANGGETIRKRNHPNPGVIVVNDGYNFAVVHIFIFTVWIFYVAKNGLTWGLIAFFFKIKKARNHTAIS